MDKGKNRRAGKIISNHSTRVEGLNNFLPTLVKWDEITSIRLGRIAHRNVVGRKSKRLRSVSSTNTGLRVVQMHKRPKRGGGFTFKATRPAMVGSQITGIACTARNGTYVQSVYLTGDDLDALKLRLHAEGYGASW